MLYVRECSLTRHLDLDQQATVMISTRALEPKREELRNGPRSSSYSVSNRNCPSQPNLSRTGAPMSGKLSVHLGPVSALSWVIQEALCLCSPLKVAEEGVLLP